MTVRPGEGTTCTETWGDWLLPAAAWEKVLNAWAPIPLAITQVDLLSARRRVLASSCIASLDSPPFDRSTVDGYALRSIDSLDASQASSVHFSVVGEVSVDSWSTQRVASGEALWVATGSMIPAGVDCVVMVERTDQRDDGFSISHMVNVGENITPRGADIREGDQVLQPGRYLRPQDIAVMASLGMEVVPVRSCPRVAILCGGDELVTPGSALRPGQIYDANTYALSAQIEEWGGKAIVMPRVADRFDQVCSALSEAADLCDIVLLSGGSSVGERDYTARAIALLGEPGVVVHGVAMRPGRPTVLGVIRSTLIIGIPGNPVTAMITCEVFARPAIEQLLGMSTPLSAGYIGQSSVNAMLAAPVQSMMGRQDYVRVRLEHDGDVPIAREVRGGSSIIRTMVEADGLIVVGPEYDVIEANAMVTVRLFAQSQQS